MKILSLLLLALDTDKHVVNEVIIGIQNNQISNEKLRHCETITQRKIQVLVDKSQKAALQNHFDLVDSLGLEINKLHQIIALINAFRYLNELYFFRDIRTGMSQVDREQLPCHTATFSTLAPANLNGYLYFQSAIQPPSISEDPRQAIEKQREMIAVMITEINNN